MTRFTMQWRIIIFVQHHRNDGRKIQGVQSKLRNRRSTSLKRSWFWIRFFKFISQKEVTFVTIKTKVKEREPLFCCWTCTILLLMVGKFEREISTKLITLLILRLPAKIQKYQIGPAGDFTTQHGWPEKYEFLLKFLLRQPYVMCH